MAVDISRSCHLVLLLFLNLCLRHLIPTIFSSIRPSILRLGFQSTPIYSVNYNLSTPNMLSPFPYLPLFFSMFFFIYSTAHFLIFRNWTPKLRPEAASCLISLAHGTPAALLASQSIISDPNHSFASTNTDFQNSVLEYSIAYFLMDLFHYLIFNPSDVLFIGHHLATLFVFVTCRYLVFHGAYGVLVLLILAEVTSFFQNVWTMASVLRVESKVAAQVFDVMSPPFYALYSVVRGVLGPLFVYNMVAFYLSGAADSVIPPWVWISWICVVVGAISVSILWITNRWIELYRERISVIDKEKKIR